MSFPFHLYAICSLTAQKRSFEKAVRLPVSALAFCILCEVPADATDWQKLRLVPLGGRSGAGACAYICWVNQSTSMCAQPLLVTKRPLGTLVGHSCNYKLSMVSPISIMKNSSTKNASLCTALVLCASPCVFMLLVPMFLMMNSHHLAQVSVLVHPYSFLQSY